MLKFKGGDLMKKLIFLVLITSVLSVVVLLAGQPCWKTNSCGGWQPIPTPTPVASVA